MKVLHITPYITNKAHPNFFRNQTGFGYMVHDIAEYVGKITDNSLFAVMPMTPSMHLDSFCIIGHSWGDLLRHFSFRSLCDGIRFCQKYRQPLKSQLRSLYIYVTIGQIAGIVKEYDVVHIHGCSEITDATIRVCKRKGVPFVVTLHGLNSFVSATRLHPSLKHYERDFLKTAALHHYPVSFISTGNMKAAAGSTGINVDSFYVICNGCNVTQKPFNVDVRLCYGIKAGDFVFAFVGNISLNKNQLQVARAWKLLKDDDKNRCKILFVGNYRETDDVVTFIREYNLQDRLILCGQQPKERISEFYYAADATILTSITEGFGLSIIEGFVYGKPNVTFADLPATQDLYDECAMLLAENRSDEALANAMHEAMHTTFDRDKIISHAQQFSFERMSEKYSELYKKVAQ